MKAKESGEGKGYAFVAFKTKELASQAIEELNNSEFKVFWCTCLLSFSVISGGYLVHDYQVMDLKYSILSLWLASLDCRIIISFI